MKVCGQVILNVHGREMTFSEQELIAIVEKHFHNEVTEQVTIVKMAYPPTEGKWFEVNPQAIDQTFFQMKRKDWRQERTRKLIQEALDKVKSNPEKYGKKFKTLIPEKAWETKTIEELQQLACELGDHNADWVEQALEWAQRICNGESWETICNNDDTANWFRLVVWKSGYARFVGGSSFYYDEHPASDVIDYDCDSRCRCNDTVPLVVLYDK